MALTRTRLSLAILALVVAAATLPLGEKITARARPAPSLHEGFVVPLTRRSMRQGSPVRDDSAAVFDPTYPQKEIESVLDKYKDAARFLQGVGLNPDHVVDSDVADHYGSASQPFDIAANCSNVADAQFPCQRKRSDQSNFGAEQPSVSASDTESQPGPPKQGALLPVYNGAGVEALRDYISGTEDLLYYGLLEIGTPAQSLTVDFDTGSSDLWLPTQCGRCTGRQFDAARSSTYRPSGKPFSVTYGSGRVAGALATDVVTIAGQTVSSQTFGAVNDESADFVDQPNDGLIGMAFGTISQSRAPTFFENLISQRTLNSPLFGIHLERGRVQGSEVCIGCINSNKMAGELKWIPVKSKTYWSVGLDGIIAGGHSFKTDIIAAIDTGTTLIYLPERFAAAFYRALGGRPASHYGQGFYTYPCAARLNIKFVLGGNAFELDPQDFSLGRTSARSPDCVGSVLALSSQKGFPDNLAIIGDAFLKSWYSVYDYSNGARVGLAPSINNK